MTTTTNQLTIHGEVSGKESAERLAKQKLAFVLNRADKPVQIFVKRLKNAQLVRVKMIATVAGKDYVIKTEEHRKLEKCLDELASRIKPLYVRDKKQRRQGKKVQPTQPNNEEEKDEYEDE